MIDLHRDAGFQFPSKKWWHVISMAALGVKGAFKGGERL
jgi:hypothetical protein